MDEDLSAAYPAYCHAVIQTVKVENWSVTKRGELVDEKLEVFAVDQRRRCFQLNMGMHCPMYVNLVQLLREVAVCLNAILSTVVLHLYRVLTFKIWPLVIQNL